MPTITVPVARRAVTTAPRVAVAAHAQRPFTTTLATQRTPTESVKDGLKKVDRAVSDKIVVGLDGAMSAKKKVQEGAEKVSHQSSGKAEEMKGEAKSAAEEVKGEAKGAAAEAEGKVKGAAEKAKEKL